MLCSYTWLKIFVVEIIFDKFNFDKITFPSSFSVFLIDEKVSFEIKGKGCFELDKCVKYIDELFLKKLEEVTFPSSFNEIKRWLLYVSLEKL